MGAPGPYTWRGTIFGQVVVGNFLTRDKTIYHGPLSDTDIIEGYSYLGMSVGGGHFFNKNIYSYVSGAPRSKMKGQVYFFEKYNSEELNISLIITGEQFASSFGYELLATDVNNDGYDDLLVGAPFYYGEKKGGAVYVYYNIRGCTWNNCTWDKVFYGKAESRFGFSMTSLGDINKDGYNDVAIGAPYEAGHGAVYIYLGSQNGLNPEPTQVIRIKQLTTLGYSLSGGMDMDNNGYPDLLVGAYESEKVLLFKSRPIIDIKIKIISNELKNINSTKRGCLADPTNSNYTCFSFQSCFSIMGKLKKLDSFNVKKHVSRIWFRDELYIDRRSSVHTATVTVTSTLKQYCHDETVYIKEGITDILSPIKFRVNYTLENNIYHSPILNKTSVKSFEATFQKECGDDDICESNLVLSITTNLKKNVDGSYKVDKVDEDFILETSVSNLNEPAYEAKLFIVHPSALSYIALKTDKDDRINIKCSVTNETLVICDLGNPFHGNQSINLNLRFELIKATKEQKLDLRVFVNSTSRELSKQTSQTLVAILQKIAEFHISGKGTSNLIYGGKVIGESAMKNLEDIGARVTHKYQIDNNGQWDLPDVKVIIRWPIQVSPGPGMESRPGKWLLYLESVPVLSVRENETFHSRRKRDINYVVPTQTTERGGKKHEIVIMDCITGTAKCVEIICSVKDLKKGNSAYVDIKSRIWNSTLVEDYSKVDWVMIKSNLEVEITDKSFNISSESVPQFSAVTIAYPEIVLGERLNWWIIGGAVLAGLVLLILLVVILYKCGFFKRKRVSKDPTLSGNLQKKGESENLLTNK
ncbi:hypothetical protein NQ315_008342 [Exocentrus adspersus]|uniref:Integrin alpha-2 domain-containing protein n=1 Tax=Exocentrus adspersus TaxID=1586481 RepID=A0AAV8VAX3_9CUCU|nr:hypothetical protein NQ315_008342 [Exocentrus adspersus]